MPGRVAQKYPNADITYKMETIISDPTVKLSGVKYSLIIV